MCRTSSSRAGRLRPQSFLFSRCTGVQIARAWRRQSVGPSLCQRHMLSFRSARPPASPSACPPTLSVGFAGLLVGLVLVVPRASWLRNQFAGTDRPLRSCARCSAAIRARNRYLNLNRTELERNQVRNSVR